MKMKNHGYKFSMNCIQKFIAVFLLTAVLFTLVNCSQTSNVYGTEEVIIQLPQFPDVSTSNSENTYPRLSRWLIQIEAQNISESYYVGPTWPLQFSLELPINQPAAITATPVTLINDTNFETAFFKPAGTIYPYNWDNGLLQMTWENGFTASIMQSIFRSSLETEISRYDINNFISCINWKKFSNTILDYTQKSKETFIKKDETSPKFYNPWQLDRELLLENLTNRIFSSDYLKTKYIISVEQSSLNLPENTICLSSYIPENQIIDEYKSLSLKKNVPQNFMLIENQKNETTQNEYNLQLICTSAKKVSLEVLYLPILIDEYEY